MKRMSFPALSVFVFIFLVALSASGAIPSTESKLMPGDPSIFRHFGAAVAVDGDTAVVGTPLDSDADFNAGAVYIFLRSGDAWTQQAKLIASDATSGSEFGYAVSLSGDTLVVGAHLDASGGPNAGAAYVFERSGSTWTQQAKLIPGDATSGKQFGAAVALVGDTAVVGAIGDGEGGFNAGAVYVFTRSGSAWNQQAKLLSSDSRPGNLFGFSVALNASTLAVGSPFDDDSGVPDSGAVYVFSGSGMAWSQEAKLRSDDAAPDDHLGWTVALDGDSVAAGAPQNDSAAEFSGAAYVFVRGAGFWSQEAKLVADDGASNNYFGYSIALDGNYAVIGSVLDSSFAMFGGSAYIFTRSGTSWAQSSEFSAGDVLDSDEFGFAVALSGTTILIGAPFSDGLDDGAAYVYIAAAPSNSAPVANAQSVVTAEDSAVPITLTGTDADGDALTFTVLSNPTKGVLTGTAPNLLFTPAPDGTGADSFTFKVNDGMIDSTVATVSITITPVNHAPVADASASPTQVISPNNSDALVTLDGSRSSDPDGDALTYTWFANGDLATPIGAGVVGVVQLNVGKREIVLRVDDGIAINYAFTVVHVITAAEATRALMKKVQAADIHRGKKSLLLGTLKAATCYFEKGKMDAGVRQLQWFQKIVRSHEGKKIDEATAECLLAESQRIIDAVSGN